MTPVINNYSQQSEILKHPTIIEQQQQRPQDDLNIERQQPSRRRFQKRKQMKRSKSVDLYQESLPFNSSTISGELNKPYPQHKSTNREYIDERDNLSSASSSSSSSTADIERVNRAALLRYKSLDSMTFNNRHSTKNDTNNRRAMSKIVEYDFDSDDSVCGIPKPRK